MNAPFRLALGAVLLCVSVTLLGCPPDTSPEEPGPTDGGVTGPTSCVVDQDCPDPALFFCNRATSTCEAACRTQADCSAQRRGAYRLEACDANPLGCRCDNNRCVVALCSADGECGADKVCRDGQCGSPPAASAVTACRVVPDLVTGREGTQARFDVLAVGASREPVVLAAGTSWAAVAVAVQGGGAGTSASFTLGAPTAEAVEAVEARVGPVTCRARVRVLGAVPAGKVRAVVTDEQTGRPVADAVVVKADAEGTTTGSARTDASGVALVDALAGEGSVTVFHEDYGYLTVAHEGAAGPVDLALPVRRNPTDRYGGYLGSFRNVPTGQELHLGVAGLSAPDAVTDLSAVLLVGPSRTVDFTFNGQTREVTLPAGAYAVLGNQVLQTEVSARGLAGVCDARLAGVTDAEAEMALGACGTRTAWALAGDIPLNELPPSLLTGGAVDQNQLLAQLLPLLRRFSSSVVRDVQYRLSETPGMSTGEPDFSNQTHFTRVEHDFQQMPLGFHFAVRVPELPRYRGLWMDSAFVLGAAQVPGRGSVPLGLGLAVNTTPADPNTDTQAGLPAPGLVSVRMAPTHHGLEGNPYALILMASSSAAANDASAGIASSVLMHRLAGGKLPFDPRGNAPVTVSGAFLPAPEGARYNYTREAYRGLFGRQLRFVTAPELPGATVLRAAFTNRSEHHWVVLMDPAKAITGVRLPLPPTGFEDRTYFGDVAGTRSPFAVQALALRAGGSALDLKGLVTADGADLERLGELATAYSALDYGRPQVAWVTPAEDGQSVAREATVKVLVSRFRLGSAFTDDGYVKLTFAGGTGCEGQEVPGTVDVSQGRGEVDLKLPAGCSGTGVQLIATLVDPDGVPLIPPVSSTHSVTIP